MKPGPTAAPAAPEQEITRREFEAVIRRAADLHAGDTDGDERISEAELYRAAAELGLPAAHVRQALFELPTSTGSSLLDHICGSARVGADRVIPGEADRTAARLDEYLTTYEYLRLDGRQPGRVSYVPAQDTILRPTRARGRRSVRSYTARARRTLLAVQPLEPGRTHVRLELDLGDQRRRIVADGLMSGGVLGALTGAGLALLAGFTAADVAGQAGGILVGALVFGGTTVTGIAAGLELARKKVRRRLTRARHEIHILLDHLEGGAPLEPPSGASRRRPRS